ncbi:MAG: VOC family protein [Mycobacteriales bacterium]
MQPTDPAPPWRRTRVARPVRDLAASRAFYAGLLGLREQGSFTGHAGYNGCFLGLPGGGQLELTTGGPDPVPQTADDLLVLYLADRAELNAAVDRLVAAAVLRVTAENPYWEEHGATFVDPDGYRLVIAMDEPAR